MMNKEIISTYSFTNLERLHIAMERLAEDVALYPQHHPAEVYVEGSFNLVEETLSDGSKALNVVFGSNT